MEDSMLPSPPPKPDFTSRIKLKHRYTELKSIFYEIKNRSNGYKAELSEKESKESKLRSECDLILDQIELIRTRLPLPSNDDASLDEEPERKRIKRYQTHDPSLPFLFDSDGEEDAGEEDADGYNERDDESEGGRTEMDASSITSLGTQSIGAQPSRPPIDQDMNGEEDADAEVDEDDEDDEDAEADEDDSDDADDGQLEPIQSYQP
ncbi:uncharacterized protein MELLADRAFT_72816 [Melampsora larici-populina 98AG31]|uniref:Uncharacterized protein n=1 Tax=Melampsora larici-populina (strain 98AG31 / pathotype 3-4-7) TaxID=747676 RepID=F4RZ84_MELLP|nr:uncharacterized protein MELLADRAFT_72816 [Melampsora larici-populina 98AG31]EGG02181.1 hypothetical protein MELLADRAFT_72816 [Melampsora larici-populina 98AG31]